MGEKSVTLKSMIISTEWPPRYNKLWNILSRY